MPIETKSTEIDGMQVSTTQYAARRQNRLLIRLGRDFGTAIGVLLKAMIGGGAPEVVADALMQEDVGEILSSMFSKLSADEVDGLTEDILAGTTVVHEGKNVTLSDGASIDKVFSGRLILMYKVMGHALKVNFADFSEAARSLARGAAEKSAPKTE